MSTLGRPSTAVPNSAPELLEMARMCLAEAGYPNAICVLMDDPYNPGKQTVGISVNVPPDVMYQAAATCGVLRRCRACWFSDHRCREDNHHEDCTGDGWDL